MCNSLGRLFLGFNSNFFVVSRVIMTEEIDVDFLITLVQARSVLWDKSLNDFKNRDITIKVGA